MKDVRIAFLGDIFPGGVLHGSHEPCISSEVAEYLHQFDLRVGTLESAFGTKKDYAFDELKMRDKCNIIFAPNEDVRRLKEIGVDVVSLANNHTTDLGREGLTNTIGVLEANGIRHVGAGRDISQARGPLIVEVHGCRIGFLAFYDTKYAPHPASESSWGVCTSENVLKTVAKAKAACDWLFVLPHWGFENSHRPLPEDRKLARRIIDAGADGVVGSHTHMIQPLISYRRKPVFFSLGNFLFPDFYQEPPRPVWYPDGSVNLETVPAVEAYGRNLKTHVKHVDRQEARVGLIGDIRLSGRRVEATVRFTYLDGNNQTVFLKNAGTHALKIAILGLGVRYPCYRGLFLMGECYGFLKRRLRCG